MNEDAERAAPEHLASLMGLPDEGAKAWHPGELADILAHQLRAPLTADLGPVASGTIAEPATFGALLTHHAPPLELLRLTKEFGKAGDRRPQSPIPTEVATVLYYAAIAAASLRHGEWITELDRAAVAAGAAWALGQPWLDDLSRHLFAEYAARDATAGSASNPPAPPLP